MRHRHADSALGAVLERRVFDLGDPAQFSFFYYADSAEELRDYLATKWRETRITDATHAQVVAAVAAAPGARLRLHELVGIRTLLPR